jgi:shikimate kinase
VQERRRVILVGMMGSGKTTVGRLLAKRLGWRYVDNDDLVRELTGSTPRQLHREHGTDALRSAESRAVARALAEPGPAIIGIAAGTILDETDRQRLRSVDTVVWLRATPETLFQRAIGGEHRPWIESGEGWFVAAAHERDPLFASIADLTVETDERTPNDVAGIIAAWLST